MLSQAELTSYLILIIAPICAYLGISEILSSAIAGAIAGIIVLIVAIKNEQHPSDVLSKSEEEEPEETLDAQ